jgi:sarcosine/dimethylglycine N-methyltransferase
MQRPETPTQQEYGKNPIKVRETNHYQKEYVRSFVNKWDELIDWERRSQSEGDFFIRLLKERGAHKVLDAATGTGYHSVQLLRHGFEVVSADGAPEMLARAFDNAREHGLILKTVHADWRWLNRDVHEKFDAVICLGNSFTHLHAERDRRKALAEFYAVLRHDGVLILDQRNYDAIMDQGYSSKHTYYYCGDQVSVYPEYVDEGLARFKYCFPDRSEFHLNMFPLRREYVRDLMTQVGFQSVQTFGDFQETYREEEPDFFVHLAEKRYVEPKKPAADNEYSGTVNVARNYYNSNDADNFYFHVWGGEDIHIGLYEEGDSIAEASQKTDQFMADCLNKLGVNSHVLDLGSGYGGAARFLAQNYHCRVTCLNLSEVENERNRQKNRMAKLEHLIRVEAGSFEEVPFPEDTFDVIWSQDALLHSGSRQSVLEEMQRVLRPGGELVFSDIMQTDDCPEGVLQPILERIHLESLGSPAFYREQLQELGFVEKDFHDYTPQLIHHYQRVLEETERREATLRQHVSEDYLRRMKLGLQRWVDGGRNGYLVWGVFHFRRPVNS